MQWNEGGLIDDISSTLVEGRLSVLVGAGVSVGAGLPTWAKLIESFTEFCEELVDEGFGGSLEAGRELIADARARASADPAAVADALRGALRELAEEREAELSIEGEFRRWFTGQFTGAKPAVAHRLIVETGFKQVLTTNYDDLLQKADLSRRFKFQVFSKGEISKVAAAFYEGRSCIVHVHGKSGDVHLNDVVFSASDYRAFFARNPALNLLLRGLLVTQSLLLVGYGGRDHNVEAVIDEVGALLRWGGANMGTRVYHIVQKSDIGPVAEKYGRLRGVQLVGVEDGFTDLEDLLARLKDACPYLPKR